MRALRLTLGFSIVALAVVAAAPPASARRSVLGSLWHGPGRKRTRQERLIRRNYRQGKRRERKVARRMRVRHPLSSIQRELVMVDRQGRALTDPETGETRRLDVVAISRLTGRVTHAVEVTSKTADKRAQKAKTRRILRRYKYVGIRDRRTGKWRRIRRRGLRRTHFAIRRRR